MTGASGFVGAALARALSDSGKRVRALEHVAEAPFADERVRGSVVDPEVRRDAVRGAGAVFHCAAAIDADERRADEVNHRATIALAHDARAAGVRRFVFVSSQAAIGTPHGSGALAEDAPCAPATIYGRSKRAAERALLAAELAPMRLTIVRPPVVYGPGERRTFLALARAIATRVVPRIGDGTNRMSFCHVENLADALALVEAREIDGVVHAADARPVTQRELMETIARALEIRVMPLPIPLALGRAIARGAELAFAPLGRRPPLDRARLAALIADRPLDTTRLASLGFTARVGFDEGVRETVESYLRDGVLRDKHP